MATIRGRLVRVDLRFTKYWICLSLSRPLSLSLSAPQKIPSVREGKGHDTSWFLKRLSTFSPRFFISFIFIKERKKERKKKNVDGSSVGISLRPRKYYYVLL
jgi:hypothetical protein